MANNFIDELLNKMPQQGNAFSPGATPTQNPMLAPVDILQGSIPQAAPPQTIGAQPFTPTLGAAPQARTGTQVPPNLGLGIPSMLDPTLSTGDFSGTGGGIGEFSSNLKEGSIFRSGGPAPSVLEAQARGEISEPTGSILPEGTQPLGLATPSPATNIPPALDGSPQDFFLSQTNDGTQALSPEQIARGQAFAEQQGMNFDPTTGFSQGTGAAPQQGLTTLSGIPLNEFLSGDAIPEAGLVEAQPLGGRGDSGAAGEAAMQAAGELAGTRARADGTFAAPSRGEARGPDSRDNQTGISDADRRDMAKANARGASASDVARGNKVADRAGVDLKTGQSKTTGLTVEQELAQRKQEFAEGKFKYQLATDHADSLAKGVEASKQAATDEAKAQTAGRTMTSAIANMGEAMTRMGGRSEDFFGSGFMGKAASFIPGTPAYDQVADIEFIRSNVALNAMTELKKLSATGSTGFGALSAPELKILTDKYANLNPFVSPKLFQSNLRQLDDEFNAMVDNAWNVHSAEFGEEKATALYGNRGGGGSGGGSQQRHANDQDHGAKVETHFQG